MTFECVKTTSEYHRNPASNLELKLVSKDPFHVSNKGWLSERYGKGYQSLVFKLSQMSSLKRMRIVSHEICISKKIEVSVGVGNQSSTAAYRVAGHIFFSNNRQTGWKAREEKVVSMDDATANFLKLRLFECHPVKQNAYGQVGIVILELEGVKGDQSGAMEQVREYSQLAQQQAAIQVGGKSTWRQMSWEEKHSVLQQNVPTVVEEDDENLPRIFAEAGIDWEKHGFSTSLGGGANRSTSPQATMGAEEFPQLPGMMSEVDQVLHGLGLPLELIRQPNMSNPTMDYTTSRLLEVIDREKNDAVQQEEFNKALELSAITEQLVSIGNEMQSLKKAKEFAVLTGDYKTAAKAKATMEQLDARRMVIGMQTPERQAALAPPPSWEDEERERVASRARKQGNLFKRQPIGRPTGRPTERRMASPRANKPLVVKKEQPSHIAREQPIGNQQQEVGGKSSVTTVAGSSNGAKIEKRVDESNGKLISKEEFLNTYGGLKEWNKAMTMEQMAGVETGGLDDFHVEDDEHHDDPFGEQGQQLEISKQTDDALTEECEKMLLETAELEAVRNELKKMNLIKYLKKMMAEMVESVKDLQELEPKDLKTIGLNGEEAQRYYEWKRVLTEAETKAAEAKADAEKVRIVKATAAQKSEQEENKQENKVQKKQKQEEEKQEEEKPLEQKLEDNSKKQTLETLPATVADATSTEEDGAATKLQAIQRGNSARKDTEKKKSEKEETDAATKLQAIQRGNSTRNDIGKKSNIDEDEGQTTSQEKPLPPSKDDTLDRSLHPADAAHQAPPNQNHNPVLKKHIEEWLKKNTNKEETYTIPDAINGPTRSDMLRAIKLFGDEVVACLLAKKWKLRECALSVVLDELYNVTKSYNPTDNYDNKVNVTSEMVAYGALSDTLLGVFAAATALVMEVFSAKFCAGMNSADIDAGLEHCVPHLVKRTGDDKSPIRDNAFKAITTLVERPHVSTNTVSKIVMAEEKHLTNHRATVGHLTILCVLVSAGGLKGEGNPLTLPKAMKFAVKSIADQKKDVRQAAGDLICEIWKTQQNNTECEKYLTKSKLDTINKVGAALTEDQNKGVVPENRASEWVWVNPKLIEHIKRLRAGTKDGKEAARLAKNKHLASTAKGAAASRRLKKKTGAKSKANNESKKKMPIGKKPPPGGKGSKKKPPPGGKKKVPPGGKGGKKKPAPGGKKTPGGKPADKPNSEKPTEKSTAEKKAAEKKAAEKKTVELPQADKEEKKTTNATPINEAALKSAKVKVKRGLTKQQLVQKASGVKKKDCAIQ